MLEVILIGVIYNTEKNESTQTIQNQINQALGIGFSGLSSYPGFMGTKKPCKRSSFSLICFKAPVEKSRKHAYAGVKVNYVKYTLCNIRSLIVSTLKLSSIKSKDFKQKLCYYTTTCIHFTSSSAYGSRKRCY